MLTPSDCSSALGNNSHPRASWPASAGLSAELPDTRRCAKCHPQFRANLRRLKPRAVLHDWQLERRPGRESSLYWAPLPPSPSPSQHIVLGPYYLPFFSSPAATSRTCVPSHFPLSDTPAPGQSWCLGWLQKRETYAVTEGPELRRALSLAQCSAVSSWNS